MCVDVNHVNAVAKDVVYCNFGLLIIGAHCVASLDMNLNSTTELQILEEHSG